MGERIQNFELISDWKIANCSCIAQAKDASGRKYFLKKYSTYKMPRDDGSITPKGYEKLKKSFEEFTGYRKSINEALSSFAGTGGNIILPSKWFIHDINYIEATEFIEDVIDTEDVYKLPEKDINMIMLTAAAALHNVHRKKVVHSDIKPQNVLIAKNSMGTITAKLIDFDISYFEDNIRADDVGGDQNYMSPEVVELRNRDCDPDFAKTHLSTKADIFSLGLLFHNLLTKGEFPEITNLSGIMLKKKEKGKHVYWMMAENRE
jgi:serine/threonine protein kinase